MSVRRHVYLAEAEDHALGDESRRTGMSVSQLIRRAVERCYGAHPQLTESRGDALAARLREIPAPDDRFADDLETIQAAQPLAGKPEWPG